MSDLTTVGVVITAELLGHLTGSKDAALLAQRVEPLQRMLDRGDANTPLRAAAVLARVCTETEDLLLVKEEPSADGSGLNFERYLNRGGNLTLADCRAYCGHGFLEVTFKEEYEKLTEWCHANGFPEVDFVTRPDDVLLPQYLGLESAWYLETHTAILAYADAGKVDQVSCMVNAGMTVEQVVARHGELIDGAVAAAYNHRMKISGATDWTPKHGIWGLLETQRHYKVCEAGFGLL